MEIQRFWVAQRFTAAIEAPNAFDRLQPLRCILKKRPLQKWAVFQRIKVSPEDLQADEDAQRETMEGLRTLFADADNGSVERDGLQHFSLTFDLTKSERATPGDAPWWRHIFRRLSRPRGV